MRQFESVDVWCRQLGGYFVVRRLQPALERHCLEYAPARVPCRGGSVSADAKCMLMPMMLVRLPGVSAVVSDPSFRACWQTEAHLRKLSAMLFVRAWRIL
jgi:hypothetical protein